jgi:polyferredoxin
MAPPLVAASVLSLLLLKPFTRYLPDSDNLYSTVTSTKPFTLLLLLLETFVLVPLLFATPKLPSIDKRLLK